jgi:hypothetical protein
MKHRVYVPAACDDRTEIADLLRESRRRLGEKTETEESRRDASN